MSDETYSDETRILTTKEFRLDELEGDESERSAVLTVLRGRRRGATFQVGATTTVLGRGEHAEIRLDDDGVSRRHAELVRLDDGAVQLRDLNSTNGTFVNGEKVSERVLEDDDRVALGTTTLLKFELHDAMEIKLKAEMYQKATRDQLTGMFNRRYCFERLREEFSFARRHGEALSVVMFDVDHFKLVNDTYGHAAGDAVLQRIGLVVMELVRNEDVVCRYGGEEFVCILRGLTLDQGELFADRVRRTIEAQKVMSGEHTLEVTVSLGVASLDSMNFETPEEMVNEADAYLYVAKEGGRNQVSSARTVAVE
jgi:two-component system cell cycle response regulator